MPVSISLAFAVMALVLAWRLKRRGSIACMLASMVVLWVPSMPIVAGYIIWSLQRQYPPIALQDIPASDCIVLLGGVMGAANYPRVEIELTETIDRVYQSAKLYRLQKGQTVIVAAGNQPGAQHLRSEAEMIKDLLIEWGVPGTRILTDTTSRNTHENAQNASLLIRHAGCESSLLVTSAWHMPRALASFAAQGTEMTAVPVDVRFVQSDGGTFGLFFPRADALATTSQALLEWMGIWVYRFRGWN